MEEFSKLASMEKIWSRDGEKNTKFFHKMANAHSTKNFLGQVKIISTRWMGCQGFSIPSIRIGRMGT